MLNLLLTLVVFMFILGMGLLLAAFIPQLLQNYYLKSKATDSVVPIFLILASLGVLLRFPGLRNQLHQAKKSKKNIALAVLGVLSGILPAAAHTIWAWQCAWYDSEKAKEEKDILIVAAPILSIMIVIITIWTITV